MRKRNAKIQEFVTANNAKPLCAKLGPKTHGIIASGDDKNAVSLWRLNKDRPLMTLSSQGASQTVTSEVSAICFNINENEVFSGTNRGSISVWDINGQKLITTLKGHAAAINTISHFPAPAQEHLILTGSYDFSVKLWDLRQKQSVATFKGHHMQINCIESTPDGKWFASGSQDSLVKLWDIGTGRVIQTFNQHESPITCLKFNPYDLTLSSGSADKTIKYWDLEKFDLICSTKTESTGIQALAFDLDGKYMFSAAQDILRVWFVEADDLKILDNVEATWRGVQDLAIQMNSKNEEENLIGVAITNVSFGLWCCPLKTVNKDPNISPEKFYQMRKQLEAKMKPVTQSQDMDQPFADMERPSSKSKPVSDPSVSKEGFAQQPQVNPTQPQRTSYPSSSNNVFVQQAQNNLLPSSSYPSSMGVNPMGNNQPQPQVMQSAMNFYQMGQYPNNPMMTPQQMTPQNMFPVQQMPPNMPNQFGIPNQQYYGINPAQSQEFVQPGVQDSLQNFMGQPVLTKKNSLPKEKMSVEKKAPVQVHDPGLMAKLNDNPMNEEKLPLREEDRNQKDTTMSIIEVNKADPSQLNLSSFIGGIENKEKNIHFDAISDITKDHSKFKAFMTQRLNHLELVLHHWNSGNVRSALNAINVLNLNDSTLLMDLLNMSSAAVNKTGQMNVDAACIFLQKATMLIDSKFDHHVKMGFQFITKTFRQFHDEVVKIKTANVMNMVDLAREERLKKYDKLINEFEAITHKDRIKKLAAKNKDEIGELAAQLLTDLELFLNKVKAGDSGRR